MPPIMIIVLAFLGVAALVGTLAFVFTDNSGGKVTERLEALTGRRVKDDASAGILRRAAFEQDKKSLLQALTPKMPSIDKYFQQADCHIVPSTLFGVSAGLCVLGASLSWVL